LEAKAREEMVPEERVERVFRLFKRRVKRLEPE